MISEADLNHSVHRSESDQLPEPYRGKVRDVYKLPDDVLAIITTDRVSAFDYILPQTIPYKGQILNRLAAHAFVEASKVMPTHMIDMPHPNIMVARACRILPIEIVVRGYLAGHAWREYQAGKREVCGVPLPDGLKQNQKLPEPIITPTTKAAHGHDEDITEDEVLRQGLVSAEIWQNIKDYAFRLFELGTQNASRHELILVDTKYEFGEADGELILADEVHTPDSSRFFYADGFEERLQKGEKQKQLSKEFVREWLMEHGFSGKEGQPMPQLSDEFRIQVYERYAELFKLMTGKEFTPTPTKGFNEQLPEILKPWL